MELVSYLVMYRISEGNIYSLIWYCSEHGEGTVKTNNI